MQVRPFFVYNILKLWHITRLSIAALSTLKQVRFFGPPCIYSTCTCRIRNLHAKCPWSWLMHQQWCKLLNVILRF